MAPMAILPYYGDIFGSWGGLRNRNVTTIFSFRSERNPDERGYIESRWQAWPRISLRSCALLHLSVSIKIAPGQLERNVLRGCGGM
jgi:hypothetical protein